MYTKHMEQIGMTSKMISKSVAYGILQKCSATKRHPLTCVDYYMAYGADAFEDIDDILDTLQGMALLDADMAKLWKYNVAQSRLYLKTDLRMHLKMDSHCIDHCYIHALSDPSSVDVFRYKGNDHTHTVRCPRCEMMDSCFNKIKSLIGSLNDSMKDGDISKKTVSEMKIRMEQNVDKILEMKKHLVRAGYTELERTRLISELNDGEAFVTMDFAQKFLPMYKWESQSKYFGKRGMSWHIFHIIAKINGTYVQHIMVHVVRTKKQDNHSVVQMLDQVLRELKLMNITGIHLRADNAGAYHSLGTITSIPHLSEKTKVKVLSFSFSEAQNGKSSCDRVAAQAKRKLRDYVSRGKNIISEKDLYDAIAQCGLKGLSVYLVKVKREQSETKENELVKTLQPKKMDGISGFGHFEFAERTVRAWKMYGIGDGKLFKNLSGFTREFEEEEEEGGFLASEESAKKDEAAIKNGVAPKMFWAGYLTSKGKADEEPDDVDEVDQHGEETQGELYGNLLRHLDIGKHKIRPEKINLYDCALQLYKQKLEGIQAHNSILKEAAEAMTELANGVDKCNEGWALKGKRKHVVYSEKAKKFAENLFRKGDSSQRKMDPAEVERLMKENDQIKPYERMNAQQIRSYFGTLCKAQSNKRGRAAEKKAEEEEADWEEIVDCDVENIDDLGRQLDDDIHDLIRKDINEFFQSPENPLFDDDE